MPNYAGDGSKGLIVDGVMEDRPAAKAGLLQGDIITQIGECPVEEVYSYMECLSKMTAGETYDIKFIRDGQEEVSKVTF